MSNDEKRIFINEKLEETRINEMLALAYEREQGKQEGLRQGRSAIIT